MNWVDRHHATVKRLRSGTKVRVKKYREGDVPFVGMEGRVDQVCPHECGTHVLVTLAPPGLWSQFAVRLGQAKQYAFEPGSLEVIGPPDLSHIDKKTLDTAYLTGM